MDLGPTAESLDPIATLDSHLVAELQPEVGVGLPVELYSAELMKPQLQHLSAP
tara:strand:- start:36 stop:194 length:159 start_codon:yes stop_codon:yes gene_type:complete